jgi:hypothetical protein
MIRPSLSMAPVVSTSMVEAYADKVQVCRRPLLRKVTDRATGDVTTVPIPCGSTRESVCPACADKARRLRMQQCREGWHLTEDPLPPEPGDEPDPEEANDNGADRTDRRVRSTRRLEGFPDLPKVAAEHSSIGRTFTDPKTGATFRPSMFLTLTMPSYGRIQPGTGVPAFPDSYDYRRAALDALFFSRLVDRWWQNLRRCAGYKVQYFAVVEPQRRLAPHLHTALRGSIPRATIRAVTAATYCALWWPSTDQVVYDEARGDAMPAWDPIAQGYYDPDTGALLPGWERALDDLEDDPYAEPMHVMSFGAQVDIKGILGDTDETRRAVGYLCKYLTKSIADTYADDDHTDAAYEAHVDRLHEEVRWLPCSETCANWLRFGICPKDPGPGLKPGECSSKAHDRDHLGLGGRRVLVSRHWTGKTLDDHRADRSAVVRAVLEEAGIEAPEARRLAADVLDTDGRPRFVWEDVPPPERDYARTIALSLKQKRAWATQYETAKAALASTGPAP